MRSSNNMEEELITKFEEVRNLVYDLVTKPSPIPELKEAIDKLRLDNLKAINELKSALAELLKPKKKVVIEQDALIAKEIRDTALHRSEIIEIGDFDIITIWVNNELDQPVSVQVKGNFTHSYINAVNIGSAFTVSANSVEARNLSIYREVWLPYSFCEIVAAVAPTKGAIHIKYLKRVG